MEQSVAIAPETALTAVGGYLSLIARSQRHHAEDAAGCRMCGRREDSL